MPVEFTGVDWANEDRKAQDRTRRRKLSKQRREDRQNFRRSKLLLDEKKEQVTRYNHVSSSSDGSQASTF